MRSLEAREEDRKYSGAEKVWQEMIHGIRFYHGTSAVYLPQILENGLPVRNMIHEDPAVGRFSQVMRSLDITPFDKRKVVYVSSSPHLSLLEYAHRGSEMSFDDFNIAHYPYTQTRIEEMGESANVKEGIKVLAEFFSFHRPSLLRIKRNAPTFERFFQEKFPQFDVWRKSKSVFLQDIRSLPGGIDEEESNAAGLLERYADDLEDLKVVVAIPPDEIEIVPADEVEALYDDEEKVVATIIRKFFTGIDYQPRELLDAIRVLGRFGRTRKDIEEVLETYQFPQEVRSLILQRLGFIK